MWRCACLLALLHPVTGQLPPFLARLSEEAEAFRRVAPQALSQETWTHRAAVAKRRFVPQIGSAALRREYRYETRTVISEYGYTTLSGESPDRGPTLHELRSVISVDGRTIAKAEDARRTLTLGLRSDDDRQKKRMLERFRRLGVVEPAVDFGQIILLFGRRGLDRYRFDFSREALIGAEPMLVYGFEEVEGPGALTKFEGRQMTTARLRGELWSRRRDLLPLRIAVEAVPAADSTRRDEAVIDYAMSSHGVLLPTWVAHRAWDGDFLVAENLYSYTRFRRFAADAEIRFTEVPVKPEP
jgi:hypothetical protein